MSAFSYLPRLSQVYALRTSCLIECRQIEAPHIILDGDSITGIASLQSLHLVSDHIEFADFFCNLKKLTIKLESLTAGHEMQFHGSGSKAFSELESPIVYVFNHVHSSHSNFDSETTSNAKRAYFGVPAQ